MYRDFKIMLRSKLIVNVQTTGAQRDWFLQQMKADVDFLRGLGVQDYSFLLGKHPIKAEEKKESVKNLVLRMRK